MKIKAFLGIVCLLFLGACGKNTQEAQTLTTNNTTMNMQTQGLQNGDTVAVMKTSNGTMQIKLFVNEVPKTTTNFIALAQKGYYNGLIFHRVIKNFMIQGGDPEGTGRGGQSIYGHEFEDEFNANLRNIKYSISMANAGPNTNGSQFFINQADNTYLDNKHSVFGQVVEGIESVDKISKVKTNSNDKPESDVKIISVEIKTFENGSLKDANINVDEMIKKIEDADKIKVESKKGKAAEKGDKVAVHYTGTFENGEKFDSSRDRGAPIEFTVGAGQMIPGFDNAVVGMKIGDKKKVTLAPKDAYGEYDASKKMDVAKEQLTSFTDAGIKLEVGAELPTSQGTFKILAVSATGVTIDVNSPMAGKTLIFDMELMDIK